MSSDRLSRAEERKTRYLAENIEKRFAARPGGGIPATPGADCANAPDVQDKTSGSSRSLVAPKSDEPGSDACAAPMVKRSWVNDTENDPGEISVPAAHPGPVLAAPGQKRSSPEESCDMDTDDTGGERAAHRARLALISQVVLQLHRMPEEEENNATHDDPIVDPELIILEGDRANHKMVEENLDSKLIAVAKKEE